MENLVKNAAVTGVLVLFPGLRRFVFWLGIVSLGISILFFMIYHGTRVPNEGVSDVRFLYVLITMATFPIGFGCLVYVMFAKVATVVGGRLMEQFEDEDDEEEVEEDFEEDFEEDESFRKIGKGWRPGDELPRIPV